MAGSQSPNEFQKPEVKPLSLPILLCLSIAIEPQKEEADENYNSVNTRMRKNTGVGGDPGEGQGQITQYLLGHDKNLFYPKRDEWII